MSLLPLTGRLLKWGNSFGIRLSKADVERLHLHPGDDVPLLVDAPGAARTADAAAAVDALPVLDLGGDAAADHDDLFAAGAAADHDDAVGAA